MSKKKTLPETIKPGMTVYIVLPCPYIKENVGIEETKLKFTTLLPTLECSYDSFFDAIKMEKKDWINGEEIFFVEKEAFAYAKRKYPYKNLVEIKYRDPKIKQEDINIFEQRTNFGNFSF
ncbi:hypothetical protein ACFX4N_23885 [Priestia sp. YIM B13551]|uniref:hypothetical protein n=1 Tax=Priestia sp. YIM B13551 TaxID=3366306 RepID=UPI0036713D23